MNAKMAALKQQLATMDEVGRARTAGNRNLFRDAIAQTGAFRIQAVKAASATDQYTEALQRQKVKLSDHLKQSKMRNEVLKEQYRLQRMVAVGWTEDGNGRISADAIVPRHVPERLNSVRKGIAEARAGTVGWGQVIDENRMRIGLWSQSMRSASQNLVNWGKNTQWAGRQMMMGLSLPFAALAAGTGVLAYQLDKEMTRILKVYDYAAGDVEKQQARIKESSMDTARTMARAFGQAGKDTLAIAAALAAQGKTGYGLQQATATISQGMFLGELNQEDALKTATSLLTVFREEGETTTESNKRLADSFAYMNALENATTLSMKDMTVAIPRLSGVVRLLGGDMRDIGVLMAATSAAGIEAAQGANALKSVLFTGTTARNTSKAGKTFFEATGQQIEDITTATKGDAIPTLMAIGNAYKTSGLEAQEQLRIVRDLFGIWRGGAAELVIQQLLNIQDETSNVGRAYKESQKDVEEWYEIQTKERMAMQASASGQFKIALEAIKIELAAVGEPFLKVATWILKFIAKIVRGFNEFDDFTKKLILGGAAAVAIIGPLVMIIGVVGTLLGTIARFTTGIIFAASKFKLLNAEQRVTALTAGQARMSFISEALAANRASGAIAQLSANMGQLALSQARAAMTPGAARAIVPQGPMKNYMTRDAKGRIKRATPADLASRREADHSAALVENSRRTEEAAAKTKKSMAGIAGGAAATAGMVGMMVGGTNQWVMGLSMALILFGGLNLAGKGLAAKQAIVNALTAAQQRYIYANYMAQTRLTGAIVGSAAASKAFAGSLIGAINPVGAIIAALAIAAGSVWYLKRRADEAVKRFEKLGEVAKGAAEILGLAFNETGGGQDAENGVRKKLELTSQLNEKYGEQIKLIAKMDDEAATAEIRRIGLEFYQGTGDNKAANQVMEALAQTARGGTNRLAVTIDFGTNDASQVIDGLEQQLNNMTSRKYKAGFFEIFQDTGEVSNAAKAVGKRAATSLAASFNNRLAAGDVKGATRLVEQAQVVFEKGAEERLSGIKVDDKAAFERIYGFSPDNMPRLVDKVLSEGGIADLKKKGFDEFDNQALKDYAVAYRDFLETVADKGGSSPEAAKKFKDLQTVLRNLPTYQDAVKLGSKDGADANNEYADSANAANQAALAMANGLAELSDGQKKALDMQKQLMGQVGEAALEWAADSLDARHEAAISNMEANGDAAVRRIEDESKRTDKDFENRSKAMDARHRGEDKAFTNRWKIQTKAIEDGYDSRVKKIEDVMAAEEKAEEARQKAFEAEKTRIQRLAEMYNQNIDFNVALNTGELDEAAKLANNMRATQEQWGLDDAAGSGATAAEERKTQRQAEIERLNEEKERRLEIAQEQEEREKEAMAARQEREKAALEAEKERYNESVEANRAAQEKKTKAAVDSANKSYEARKAALERELGALQAFTPRNEKEVQDHQGRIAALYAKHGFTLDVKSKEWAQYVTRAMEAAARTAEVQMSEEVKWNNIGHSIGDELANGMLGMTFAQFLEWMRTGEVPKTPTATGAAGNGNKRQIEYWESKTPKPRATGVQANHGGGAVSAGGSGRAGRPLSAGLYSDEVPIIAQKGEFMFQKEAVKKYGLEMLHKMNNGDIGPDHSGRMHGGGLVGGLGALVTAAMQNGLGAGIAMGAMRKSKELLMDGKAANVPPVLLDLLSDPARGLSTDTTNNAVAIAPPGADGFASWLTADQRRVRSDVMARVWRGLAMVPGQQLITSGLRPGAVIAGTNRPSLHGAGRAVDIGALARNMGGSAATEAMGDKIASVFRSGVIPGVSEVLWKTWQGGNHFNHVHVGFRHKGGEIGSSMTTGLKNGGYTLNDGYAKLHRSEAVLTAPLTAQLERGIANLDSGGNVKYDIKVDLTGAVIREDVDIERAIKKVLKEAENKTGKKRTIN